jgi:4-hydroxy-tetrahydrodipicolinate reductase
MMIKVAVLGALGNMGREVVAAVQDDPELGLAGVVDVRAGEEEPPSRHPVSGSTVLDDVSRLDSREVDVIVDFTVAHSAVRNIMWALDHGVHAVVGTTGISDEDIRQLADRAAAADANVLIAPNFAIGAVLMMKFSRMAASVFDQCEIVELHHRGKRDAPSGTAIATARLVEEVMKPSKIPPSEERVVPGTRGGSLGPVNIHSVRLDGLVAHQEVLFGGKGQTLSIRHDTTDRSCFMPGVIIAVKGVAAIPGLTIGLDSLL